MKLSQLIEAGQYRITSGDEYLWHSFGPNTRIISLGDETFDGISLDIMFSPENQTAFCATVSTNSAQWRWINPDFVIEYFLEHDRRGIDPKIAWDDVEVIDLDEDEFLAKVRATFAENYSNENSPS